MKVVLDADMLIGALDGSDPHHAQARALGVAVHQPGESIGVEAARLRCRHPISLPDAYCPATAKHVGASVASFDRKLSGAAEAERIAYARARPSGAAGQHRDPRARRGAPMGSTKPEDAPESGVSHPVASTVSTLG